MSHWHEGSAGPFLSHSLVGEMGCFLSWGWMSPSTCLLSTSMLNMGASFEQDGAEVGVVIG